jgi:hypothetical protein
MLRLQWKAGGDQKVTTGIPVNVANGYFLQKTN